MAPYPEISFESVIGRNPEVIIDMGDMSDTVGVSEEHKREVVALWKRASSVAAVKENRVVAIASDMYVVPGPRVVDAARALFAIFHPEAK
jgi:ABC-type Fe3+-hydroxamate transport system substrate-binding protein